MRRILIALTAVTLAAASAPAANIGVFGSYWDTDDLDDTWGVGARLRIGPPTPLALELRGTYFDDITEDGGPGDVELEAIPADVGLVLGLTDEDETLNVYLLGGGSYYFLDSNMGDVDDEIGWYAGAGADVKVSDNLFIFGEFLYRDVEATVEDDDLDLIDEDRVDLDIGGTVVNVGLAFR